MKTGDNVLFEDNDIPCLIILHFKRSPLRNEFQYGSYNGSMYTVLRKSKWWL